MFNWKQQKKNQFNSSIQSWKLSILLVQAFQLKEKLRNGTLNLIDTLFDSMTNCIDFDQPDFDVSSLLAIEWKCCQWFNYWILKQKTMGTHKDLTNWADLLR